MYTHLLLAQENEVKDFFLPVGFQIISYLGTKDNIFAVFLEDLRKIKVPP